jgi:hypothetical protein
MTSEQNDAVNQYFVHTEADLVKTDAWHDFLQHSKLIAEKDKRIKALEEENQELKKQVEINNELHKTRIETINLLKIRDVEKFQHNNLTWQWSRMRFLCGLLKICSEESLFLFTNSKAHALHAAMTDYTKKISGYLNQIEDLKAGYIDQEKYGKLAIGQRDILYELESFIFYCYKENIDNAHVRDILELYYEQMTGTDVGKRFDALQKIDDVIKAQIV